MTVQFSSLNATPAQPPASTRSLVRFGGDENQAEAASKPDEFQRESSPDEAPNTESKFKQRLRNAFSKEGLISDTKWAIAFSVAGLILPGSQLLLVPAAYSMGITLRLLGMR